MSVEEWLEALDLAQYANAFLSNDVDLDILPDLTSADLAEIGVLSVGHRRRIIKAAAHLATPTSQSPATAIQKPMPAEAPAERRQISVIFCDLVGSTAISERLDPEDMTEVITAYHDVCKTVLSRYDAYIANFMGDGVMAYFGYPRARENDTERALKASLELLEAVKRLRTPAGPGLQARVGIDTGMMVVGDVANETVHGDLSAVGKTSNRAARIQSFAEPDQLLISENTRRLCPAAFEFEDKGTHAFKGVSLPTQVWLVAAQATTQVFDESVLSPFVGRKEEMSQLLKLWDQAQDNACQTVIVNGDPGIGKSRLMRALKEELSQSAHLSYEFRGAPYFSNTAFYTLVQCLANRAAIGTEDNAAVQKLKLASLLEIEAEEHSDQLTRVVSILTQESLPKGPGGEEPAAFKSWFFETLQSHIVSATNTSPTHIEIEDAQWIDPTSLEFFSQLRVALVNKPALITMVTRPGWSSIWESDAAVQKIELLPMDRTEINILIEAVSAGENLDEEVVTEIVKRSDGVPLYLEEVTRAVLENLQLSKSNKQPSPDSQSVPSTLLEALLARLDALGTAKQIALTAACIGREFNFDILLAVSKLDADDLQAALSQLIAADLIRAEPDGVQQIFYFRHMLVQETAYNLLLRANRRDLHARIGGALENVATPQPAQIIAFQYEQAAMPSDAARLWHKVGETQIGVGGYVEALAALKNARAQISKFDYRTPDIIRLELRILAALGSALIAVGTPASTEIGEIYEEAYVLSRSVGTVPETGPVLFGLAVYFFFRGELSKTQNLCDEIIELADRTSDQTMAPGAILMRNQSNFWMGNHEFVHENIQNHAFLNGSQDNSKAQQRARYAQDPLVTSRITYVWSLHMTGKIDEATAETERTFQYAQRLNHPYSLAQAHQIKCWHYLMSGDPKACLESANALAKLSDDHGFAMLIDISNILRLWSSAKLGLQDDAAEHIMNIINKWMAAKAHLVVNSTTSLLADLALDTKQWQNGLDAIDQALQPGRTEDMNFLPELLRLKGELLWQGFGDAEAARKFFEKARKLGVKQKAYLFVLRAKTSQAILERETDNHEEFQAICRRIKKLLKKLNLNGVGVRKHPDWRRANALFSE